MQGSLCCWTNIYYRMKFIGLGFGTAGDIRCLKLLPGTSKSILLEGGICQVYQEETFFGVSPSLLTCGRSRSLCKRENHERLIRYFGRIEEMEDRERI